MTTPNAPRTPSLRVLLLGLLCAVFAGGPVPAATAADEPPENPFATFAAGLRPDRVVRLRGALVVALRAQPDVQVPLDAQVGLAGAAHDTIALPGPAGVWHVRVANRGKRPLLIPAGETLLAPLKASRSVDRPVWIEPGAATFVPVVQDATPPPDGPYVSRGRGLTPFEQTVVAADRWAERVRERNRRFGVSTARLADAGAAYATEGFQTMAAAYAKGLDRILATPGIVGVAVADDRGIFFAHVECDPKRFLAMWPFLRDGIALDGAMLEAVGAPTRPGEDAAVRATVRKLLIELAERPMRRPTFGEGWEYRWPILEPTGHWDGLATPQGPICLRMHRYPPRPTGTPPPPGSGDQPPEVVTPGTWELERRGARTAFEERLRERRAAAREKAGLRPPTSSNQPAAPQPGMSPPKPTIPQPSRPSVPAPRAPAPAPRAPAPAPPPAPAPAPAPGPSGPSSPFR